MTGLQVEMGYERVDWVESTELEHHDFISYMKVACLKATQIEQPIPSNFRVVERNGHGAWEVQTAPTPSTLPSGLSQDRKQKYQGSIITRTFRGVSPWPDSPPKGRAKIAPPFY